MANHSYYRFQPDKIGLIVATENPVPPPHAQTPETILEWAKNKLAFEPDPHQIQLMTDQSNRIIFNGARQVGKTTATAVKVLYESVHNDNSLILLAAPTLRQAGQIMVKAKTLANRLYKHLERPTQGDKGFRLPNGAEILAIPATPSNIRGFDNPRLIVVDEAAFVPDQVFLTLFAGQGVGNGARILLSTPNGQNGYFYEQWHDDKHPWTRIKVTAEQCSRIDPAFLEQMRHELGDRQYRQEFLCEFLASGHEAIPRDLFRKALRSNIRSLFPEDQK